MWCHPNFRGIPELEALNGLSLFSWRSSKYNSYYADNTYWLYQHIFAEFHNKLLEEDTPRYEVRNTLAGVKPKRALIDPIVISLIKLKHSCG